MRSKILFLQTSDPYHYRPMLSATASTVTEFCKRHGHSYESFIGIKRGYHLWQAAFNRLFMMAELVSGGYEGWCVYLDADAYIADLDFDLKSYLAQHHDRAAVMVNMGVDPQWAVNSGVVFINMGHPNGRAIVDGWNGVLSAFSDQRLREASTWESCFSDQIMLFQYLDRSPVVRADIHYESPLLINGNHSRFIRQTLRAYYPDLGPRTRAIENAVSEIMNEDRDRNENPFHAEIVQAFYRVILERDPDLDGLVHHVTVLRNLGSEAGIRNILEGMLSSYEYSLKCDSRRGLTN